MAKKYNESKLYKPTAVSDLFGELRNDKMNEAFENAKDKVIELDIDLIKPYARHHFKMPDGEEWNEFVNSIKTYGVLQPVIARKIDGYYEIIAGHKRTAGAEEAGLSTVPAIIIECDDIDASVLVGLTNKQREHITDLEWGWTYRETYELLKRKAGRPKENGTHDEHNYAGEENGTHDEHNYAGEENGAHDEHNYAGEENGAHGEHNLKGTKTVEILAEKYGVSRAVIQRKIRLTYLHEALADMYERKKLKQAVVVELSYLSLETQNKVAGLIEVENLSVSEAVAKGLRKAAEESEQELSVDDLYKIIIATDPKAAKSEEPIKDVKAKVPVGYIPQGLKKKEQEDYIIRAVKYIWENKISLE